MAIDMAYIIGALALFVVFCVAIWKVLMHFDAIRVSVKPHRDLAVNLFAPLILVRGNLEAEGQRHVRPLLIWLCVLVATTSAMLAAGMFR